MPCALSRAIAPVSDDLLNGSRCSVELCVFAPLTLAACTGGRGRASVAPLRALGLVL